MARKTSRANARTAPRRATRFIVYRTAQGYWIASAKGSRVTGAFPVSVEAARFALANRLSRYVKAGTRASTRQ